MHIPLFPPQTDEQRQALFRSMASKVGIPVPADQLPPLPSGIDIGGNEMEALLVRAMRRHDLAKPEEARPMVEEVATCISEYRPFAYVRNMEYMDLIAVKECTDDRFPARAVPRHLCGGPGDAPGGPPGHPGHVRDPQDGLPPRQQPLRRCSRSEKGRRFMPPNLPRLWSTVASGGSTE